MSLVAAPSSLWLARTLSPSAPEEVVLSADRLIPFHDLGEYDDSCHS